MCSIVDRKTLFGNSFVNNLILVLSGKISDVFWVDGGAPCEISYTLNPGLNWTCEP